MKACMFTRFILKSFPLNCKNIFSLFPLALSLNFLLLLEYENYLRKQKKIVFPLLYIHDRRKRFSYDLIPSYINILVLGNIIIV